MYVLQIVILSVSLVKADPGAFQTSPQLKDCKFQ